MKKYSFAYGSGKVTLQLDETKVIGELYGHETPPLSNIRNAVFAALDHPTESKPFKELAHPGSRIALVVSDMSRFWMRQDLVIPHVIAYLNEECGIKDEDIRIVVANGTHLGGDECELRAIVTDDIFDRIEVLNHDCLADDLCFIGTTQHGNAVRINRTVAEADQVICLGACTHHVMAGFGGGRKSILPGISSLDTIRYNHAFALDPNCLKSSSRIGNGKLVDNPLNEDMCEAAGLVKNLFMINLVMNAEMKLAAIFAGHYLSSWQEGCRKVDEIYRVPVKEKADIVVASCGGFPKDMSLYQGTKTIDNIEPGLKQGGTLILLIEARDGGGPAEYFDWIKDWQAGTMEKRLRDNFTVPGYIFLLNCEQAQRYRVMMLTSIKPEIMAGMGIEAYNDIDELMKHVDFDNKTVYVIPNGSTVIPSVEE